MNSKHIDKKKENFLKLSSKEQHKKVLQVYYDLGKKDPLRDVSRFEVADILGFKDPNDDTLLYEVIYLEDEGFLETVEQFGEKITSYGINEVENGFPSFYERPKVKSPKNDELIKKLRLLLKKINLKIDLAKGRSLRSSKLIKDEREIKEKLKIITKYLDEDFQLIFDRIDEETSLVRMGYYVNEQDVKNILKPWSDYIKAILKIEFGELPKNERHISKGEHYGGREHLRKILKSANKEIFLVDNYLNYEIFTVVKEYLDKIDTIKFLTRKKGNNYFESFSSDFKEFKKQFKKKYPNLNIKAKYNNGCHDRYIIIDINTVFNSGCSFNQLGNEISRITKSLDEGERIKCLNDLNNLWDNGHII